MKRCLAMIKITLNTPPIFNIAIITHRSDLFLNDIDIFHFLTNDNFKKNNFFVEYTLES